LDNHIIIRTIKKKDAGELMRITSAITKKPCETDFKEIISGLYKTNGEDTSFVVEKDNKIIGFMISYIIHAGFGLNKSAWIVSLGIDPDYMDQGFGKMLAQKIFNKYKEKGIQDIYSSVLWDSIDLLSFFKALGFERSDFVNLKKRL
jgi:N-acetylglutamate synthase-like GNAT family acetyltransferase